MTITSFVGVQEKLTKSVQVFLPNIMSHRHSGYVAGPGLDLRDFEINA